MQNVRSNTVTGAPQSYLVCPNDQSGASKTCEDFGDSVALSENGRILILTGGFKQQQAEGTDLQQSSYRSYVYQTTNCVSDKSPSGA